MLLGFGFEPSVTVEQNLYFIFIIRYRNFAGVLDCLAEKLFCSYSFLIVQLAQGVCSNTKCFSVSIFA